MNLEEKIDQTMPAKGYLLLIGGALLVGVVALTFVFLERFSDHEAPITFGPGPMFNQTSGK